MSQQLDSAQRHIIHNIMNLAGEKYAHEQQVNPNTTFNLLKILSAYNDILPEYGLSSVTQSRIYNYLVNVSKRYNPHSKQEWNSALSLQSSISPSRINLLSKRRKTINTPVSQFINDYIDNSKISLNSRNSRSKSIKSIDKKHLLIHRDKSQNQIKQYSINDIYRKDHSKFDSTHMLTLSRDNIKTLLSFPTCNTQDDSQQDREQFLMQNRANLFYKINTYTKVFLVLKASIIVREEIEARHLKMQKKLLKLRTKSNFNIFMKRIQEQKLRNQQLNLATTFYQSNLKNKTMKCFKALKQLSIRPKINRQQLLTKNNHSLEFVKILITQGLDFEGQKQFQHFWKQNKYQQLETLFRVFSKNIIIPKQLFESIRHQMNYNLKKLIFSAFKKNISKHTDQLKSLLIIHKQEVFLKLKESSQARKDLKEKSSICSKNHNKNILSSSLWFWRRYHLQNVKNNLIKSHLKLIYYGQLRRTGWRKLTTQIARKQQFRIKKRDQKNKIIFQEKRNTLQACFYALKNNMQKCKQQKQKVKIAIDFRQKFLLCNSFKGLLKNSLSEKQQKCLKNIFQKEQKNKLSKLFIRWKKMTSVKIITNVLKKHQLRQTFWNICQSVVQYKVEQRNIIIASIFYQNMIFQRFRHQVFQSKLTLEQKINKMQHTFNFQQKKLGFSKLRQKLKQRNQQNQIKILEKQNILNIKKYFHLKKKKQAFMKYKSQINLILDNDTRINEVRNIIKKQALNNWKQFVQISSKIRMCENKMFKTIFKLYFKKLIKQHNIYKKNNYSQKVLQQYQQKKRNIILSRCFGSFQSFNKILKCIQQKSRYHYQLKMMEKVFLALKSSAIQSRGKQQICNRSLKRIIDTKKISAFKQFRCLIKRQIEQNKRILLLNGVLVYNKQKQVFSAFKSLEQKQQLNQQQSKNIVKTIKTIHMNRFKRVFELKSIDSQPLIKYVWMNRFINQVDKKLVLNKMNDMATLHYMQSILGKSIHSFKNLANKDHQKDLMLQ